MNISRLHHIAIIGSDYELSKKFYTSVLPFQIVKEHHREDRDTWRADLRYGDIQIELFGFPKAPARVSQPEALGLRHIAFQVPDINEALSHLAKHNVPAEPIRIDPASGKRFTFFMDPDQLPIELYES